MKRGTKEKEQQIERKELFSKENFARGAHVLAGLGGTLVGTGLQANYGLTASQLLVCEVSLAFISGLGTQKWSLPFGVPVGL